MKIDILGHATLLVQTERVAVLFDPVLNDPFEDGAAVFHPPRRLNVSAMPVPNAIVLSHRHADHCDPPSLAAFPRHVRIFCPNDRHIVKLLNAMGFDNITLLARGRQYAVGDLVLHPTASDFNDVPEYGFIIRSPNGNVWNQIDSEITPLRAAKLASRFGPIRIHLARYASQNFEFFDDRRLAFPLKEYSRNLATALAVHSNLVVPFAAGFRFSDPIAWANPFLFPITAERFLRDLAELDSTLCGAIAEPGDVLDLTDGTVALRKKAAAYVSRGHADADLVRYDPAAPIPPLADPGVAAMDLTLLTRSLHKRMRAFSAWLSRSDAVRMLISKHGSLTYRIEAVAGASRRWRWTWRLTRTGAVEVKDKHAPADMTLVVAASVFNSWLALRCGTCLYRAYRRGYSTALRLRRRRTEFTANAIPFIDLPALWLRHTARSDP